MRRWFGERTLDSRLRGNDRVFKFVGFNAGTWDLFDTPRQVVRNIGY